MRIIIEFENKEILNHIPREYLRNFIYDSLRESKWAFYHDKPKYKHFCYSNLFPFNRDGLLNSNFKLIISSPHENLISTIRKALEVKPRVQFGKNTYKTINIRTIKTPSVINRLITSTPVLIRLPKSKFEKYNMTSTHDYKFWDDHEVMNAFMDSLIQNAQSRYKNFLMECELLGYNSKHENTHEITNLFSEYNYQKTVYSWDKHFIGTMWKLRIADRYKASRIVQYIYEAGLGERNSSSGSGFVNLL